MAAHKWRPEVAVLLQIKWRRRLYRTICPSVHLLHRILVIFAAPLNNSVCVLHKTCRRLCNPARESEWEATLILCLAGAALAIAVLFMAHN